MKILCENELTVPHESSCTTAANSGKIRGKKHPHSQIALFLLLLLKQKFREIAQLWSNFFLTAKISWNQNLKTASIPDRVLPRLNILLFPYSQEVPKEWKKVDPYTAQKIEDNDLKGDFLALFQRRQPDASLVSIFRYIRCTFLSNFSFFDFMFHY